MDREIERSPRRRAERTRRGGGEPPRNDDSFIGGLFVVLAVPVFVFIVPRLMYLAIAPMKGWC